MYCQIVCDSPTKQPVSVTLLYLYTNEINNVYIGCQLIVIVDIFLAPPKTQLTETYSAFVRQQY